MLVLSGLCPARGWFLLAFPLFHWFPMHEVSKQPCWKKHSRSPMPPPVSVSDQLWFSPLLPSQAYVPFRSSLGLTLFLIIPHPSEGGPWPDSPRGNKLSFHMPLQPAWAAQQAVSWAATGAVLEQAKGGDPSPLLSAGEATWGALGPVLGSPAQERPGESPVRVTKATRVLEHRGLYLSRRKLFHGVGNHMLAQVGGVCVLGRIQKPHGHGHGQLALSGPVPSGLWVEGRRWRWRRPPVGSCPMPAAPAPGDSADGDMSWVPHC